MPICFGLSTLLSALTSHQPSPALYPVSPSPLPGSTLPACSLPAGYTMNKVFVLELFLLLPQWSAKAVNLSCPLLPLLVKKTRRKKQQKSPNHSCLGILTATLENELAVMIKFIEGTQVDRAANAMVSQYHNDLHRLVSQTSGTLLSSWVPTLRAPP